MKRILLTGATSFIGQVLCRNLRDSGHSIYALIRPSSLGVNLFRGEPGIKTVLGGMDTLKASLRGIEGIDTVIHLAWGGIGSKGRADAKIQALNYAHSMELISLGADLGCNLFLGAGSQAEYGHAPEIISEETPCHPETEYGKAKLKFTEDSFAVCQNLGIRWRMPRIFSVYGPQDHSWALIPSLLRALANNETIQLTDCCQDWNFLYVEDAAKALEILADTEWEDGIYNIASSVSAPLKNFIMKVCACFPNSPTPQFGALPHGPKGSLSLRPAIDKITKNTSWRESTGFEEGIKKTILSIGHN